MSLLSRIANLLRPARVNRELDEELASHLAEASARGRDPIEARRAFGSPLRRREESRDIRLTPWLDSLRSDAVFGWRQLMKRKVTSAAAVLSLALAIGACTAAFRIIDALLLRPLPVAHAARLYSVAFQGVGVDSINSVFDSCSYPMFLRMRSAAREQAELIAVSYAGLTDLTYASDQEIEKAYLQYVSGWTFTAFGLRPAAGRLFTDEDDREPGAHPYAVISDDYWSRRFARDPNIVGRTLRIGDTPYQIVGVAEAPFTGTETGTVTDIFLPMAMKNPRTLASPNNYWLRTLVQLKEGVDPQRVHEILRATFAAMQEEKAKTLTETQRRRDPSFNEKILLEPAAAGRSNLQRDYRRSLTALGILVFLALLIACANVANLMTAQAAARAREMALRISIGAGRARLIQLVLIESAWLAFLATAIGGTFAWWAAPLVLRVVDSPENPARLALPADWRVLAFALGLALGVTCVFGLAPALRASAMKPALALRGGEDAHSRHRIMYALVALQIAFCFVVHFVAGLFVASFDRLSSQPTGFSSERILNLESASRRAQPPVLWQQVADRLRAVPGVEKVALTIWPTMSGESDVGEISVNGAPTSEVNSDILHVSPGWFDTMRIPILAGNDLPANGATPDAAVVNESFVKQYFNGASPVGKWFVISRGPGATARFQVAGVVRDARSRDNMRRPIRPTAYIPFALAGDGSFQPTARGTFVVRTAGANPLALASILRQEVPRARPEIRVGNIRTQMEIIESHTVRERLLSMLALFFAGVALLLAAIGLYGVLDYSVLQRRREIGVRMAIGAPAAHIARGVATGIFAMVFVGGIAGIALGMAAARYVASLLFQVNAASPAMIALPALTIFAAALFSALPAVVRAVRIDPAQCLRSE
jgi:putative ABC transport system permease protein